MPLGSLPPLRPHLIEPVQAYSRAASGRQGDRANDTKRSYRAICEHHDPEDPELFRPT